MKKLLITGFEPFGSENVNPSFEAVRLLDERIGEWELVKLCLPVVFTEASRTAIKKAHDVGANAILCIGQAGGRDSVTPEFVGINLMHATIPDNNGVSPVDEPILKGGSAAYFSTVPARKMTDAINALGIPAKVSYSAGAYVCNELFYSLLAHFDESSVRVGFIHVPYMTGQRKDTGPAMPLEDMVRAITAAIGEL